jgi:hypothetical protein
MDVYLSGASTLTDKGYNLVGTSDTMFDPTKTKGDILNNNPGLANSLADNGALSGYPQTLALSTTSPGYQAGYQDLAGMAGPSGTDARGLIRTWAPGDNLFVSIGAMDPNAQ